MTAAHASTLVENDSQSHGSRFIGKRNRRLLDLVFPDLEILLLQSLHESVVAVGDGYSDENKSDIEVDTTVLRNAEKTEKQTVPPRRWTCRSSSKLSP